MSARDAIPDLKVSKSSKSQLTFADALTRLTAIAEAGWGEKAPLARSSQAAFVLFHYFGESGRYRSALQALRADTSGSDVKTQNKLHAQCAKASKAFNLEQKRVVTFFVDEALARRERKSQEMLRLNPDSPESDDSWTIASIKSYAMHEKAKKKVLADHGVFALE